MAAPQTEVLITVDGVERGRVVCVPGEYVLGRNADCQIRVEADLVSRRHAKLTLNFDNAFIEDLGSSNGTLVNGKPVDGNTQLWPNQKIQVGAATVTLRRLQGEASTDMSLAPAQQAIRLMLPTEMLREKKYDIGAVVARGGMGAILDAREAAIERKVAMKVMLDTNDAGAIARFIAEAQITGQLEHPNIVPVHELGVDENGQPFYTMKMVHGITLKKLLELLATGTEATLKKYPLPALLTIFQKVCDAVGFAHSKGIIHRDLKPENVMVGEFGEVLVMDWGLAKRLKGDAAVADPLMVAAPCPSSFEATLQGMVMGTPQYMSPEQAMGRIDELDERSDIFALGGILYTILTLRPPVEGKTLDEVLHKVSSAQITAPTALQTANGAKGRKKEKGDVLDARLVKPLPHTPGGRVPAALSFVVMKALRLEREQRYQSVAALSADIEAYQGGFATTAEQAGAWKQLALLVKRNKAASIGIAAVLLVGGVLGTKTIIEGRRAERGEAAAKATLADLRRTAPVFFAQANLDFQDGKLDQAIEKLGYAIQLDEANADYHRLRAHLRQSSEHLVEAADGYRRVLALRPADASATVNLALCEKLMKESGGAALNREQKRQLLTAFREQKRTLEAAPLATLLDPDTALAREAILQRLREVRKTTGWNDINQITTLPDGTFEIRFENATLADFSVLKGLPVSRLEFQDNPISDLSTMAGLPLRELVLMRTKVSDLSPLRGMPLESLVVEGAGSDPGRRSLVADISALRGMKLKKLSLLHTNVRDISPLAGAPMEDLVLAGTRVTDIALIAQFRKLTRLEIQISPVSDLAPLAGLPLTRLACGATGVSSLAPLAGMPLKELDVEGTRITDLSPLAQCTQLEKLSLYSCTLITDLSPLSKLPLIRLTLSNQKIASLAPLRGMPLRIIEMFTVTVPDLSPLLDCPQLEALEVRECPAPVEPLRAHKTLKAIAYGDAAAPLTPVELFWKDYDAKQAAGKK